MRDGRHVSTDAVSDLTVDEMARRMVGRDPVALFPQGGWLCFLKEDVVLRAVVLEVEGLSRVGVRRHHLFGACGGDRRARRAGRTSSATSPCPAHGRRSVLGLLLGRSERQSA